MEENINKFYVYVLLDTRVSGNFTYAIEDTQLHFEYEPFYVGKGGATSQFRPLDHFSEKNVHNYLKHGIINKIKKLNLELKYQYIYENLNEAESFRLEKLLITTIGRRDTNCGPLSNFTDGGEGMSGYIYTDAQKKHRSDMLKGRSFVDKYGEEGAAVLKKKLSDSKMGNKHINYGKTYIELYGEVKAKDIALRKSKKVSGAGNGMYGKHCSEDLKEKNRIRNLRENLSKENLEARSKASKGKQWLTNGTEEVFIFPADSNEYCELGWVKGRKPVTQKTKDLNSKANKGKTKRKRTEKEKKDASKRALAREKLTCPYCNKIVDYVNYARWHGENCKYKICGVDK